MYAGNDDEGIPRVMGAGLYETRELLREIHKAPRDGPDSGRTLRIIEALRHVFRQKKKKKKKVPE
jgi:hypothetical protein